MEDYKPNSQKFKEEQKSSEKREIQKVAKGPVKIKKQGAASKFMHRLIAEDASSVKEKLIDDVVIPKVKDVLVTAAEEAVRTLFYGSSRKKKNSNITDYVSYRDYGSYDYREDREQPSSVGFNYNNVVFDNRGDAENVRRNMEAVIRKYGVVSVADFYEMVDPEYAPPFTANNYGWMNIQNAYVDHTREGYVIRLPKAMPID